jgi:superfamily II RNA helicase
VFASDSDKEDTPALEDLEIPGVVQGAVRRVQALSDWYRCEYPIQEEFHVRIAMVEAVYQWMSGTALAEICAVCGIQEGNFLRVIMKMSNLLEEWRTLATLAGDLQELEKMRGAQDQLLRGLAVCESLYLRI